MNIVLCFTAGLFGSAIVIISFLAGMEMGRKEKSDGVKVNRDNAEAIKDIYDWMNYRG